MQIESQQKVIEIVEKTGQRIAVIGPIGVGKTTYINSHFKGFIKITEPIDKILHLLKNFNKAMNKFYSGIPLTKRDISHLVEFQVAITHLRLESFLNLDPNKNYVFERTIEESDYVFCHIMKEFMPDEYWQVLHDFMEEALRYEPDYTEVIYLPFEGDNVTSDVLMERIKNRGRDSEEYITKEYIEKLQTRYNTFKQTNHYNPRKNKGCKYVTGPPAVGKTTLMKKESTLVKNIQTEHLVYWGKYLERHLRNIELWKKGLRESDDFNDTYFSQLRILTSRMKFLDENTLYERCLLEEMYVFIPQYEHLFSETQLYTLNKLYEYVYTNIINIEDQQIYCINCSLEQELLNVSKRGRLNETEIYTKEYLIEMRERYNKMYQMDVFKRIMEKGNFHVIENVYPENGNKIYKLGNEDMKETFILILLGIILIVSIFQYNK